MANRWVEVAIARPLDQLFTYRLPASWGARPIVPGTLVEVPFGRTQVTAYAMREVSSEERAKLSDLPEEKIREIQGASPSGRAAHPEILALAQFAHDYYQSPLGEVLSAAVPPTVFAQEIKRRRSPPEALPPPVLPSLTDEQRVAADGILAHSAVTLLEGVTGSGKTEVYLTVARAVLDQGKTVLFLVPEIALTTHLVQRIERALGVRVGQWHSSVADGVRRQTLEDIEAGVVQVIVGARSAVFAPIERLGLIVVDEEHDATYKQEDRVRYHARDLAIVRAKRAGARVILGSATPSLESRERVREGRYAVQKLSTRFGKAGMPTLQFVALGQELLVEGIQARLAEITLEKMRETLAAGEQVMVYLNRRGFAAFLVCGDCGEGWECPNCAISLTVHKRPPGLRCHICDHSVPIPDHCPKCLSYELEALGAGTESLEDELPRLLPEAKVLRLDRDLMTSQGRLEEALRAFRDREFNLLLGTQMLVKGHDFPGVTLVVVVLADALFRWPDFRAPERAYQTLLQVSGRAGRGDQPGQVWIQTYDPDHPVLEVLAGARTAESFLESEREMRSQLGYPPFGRLMRLRFESDDSAVARNVAQETLERLTQIEGLDCLGPSEAFLERAKGQYRWDILVKSPKVEGIQRAAQLARWMAREKKCASSVDVDPYGL